MDDYRSPYPRIRAEALMVSDPDRPGKLRQYLAHDDLVAAANAALAVERPLLLTGEPGCGKTDFAEAALNALEVARGVDPKEDHARGVFSCYVRSDSRARDLLYDYDALRRYGDAQMRAAPTRASEALNAESEASASGRAVSPHEYIDLRPLGRALLEVAPKHYPNFALIDEVDKAPRDLPNDLLLELDRGFFFIPEIPQSHVPAGPLDVDRRDTYRYCMAPAATTPRPLVIITSNTERQLPDPFLRRCVFFHIPFPKPEQLKQIVAARFGVDEPNLVSDAVTVFYALRQKSALAKKPSTSELLDWFKALTRLMEPDVAARRVALLAKSVSIADGKYVTTTDYPWSDVPLLSCLVKLREDLDRLNASA